MKRILFDTNVVRMFRLIDTKYVEAGAAVWTAVGTGVSEGVVAAPTTITSMFRNVVD